MAFEQSTSRGSQAHRLDPATLQTNQLRAGQLEGLVGATGGLPQLGQPSPLAMPGGAEMGFLNQLQGIPGQPLLRGPEQMAMGTLQGLMDPSRTQGMQDAARQQFEMLAAPSIINNLTAAGLGRSGALGEALAMGGASMALPIAQQGFEQQFGAGMGLANLGALLGPQMEQRQEGRLLTALEAAGFPRQAAFQEQVLRPQDLLMNLLTGLPTLQQPLSSSMRGRQTGFGVDFGQIGSGVLGGILGACWTADALYGEGSPDAAFARLFVNTRWPRALRRLYHAVGERLASLVKRNRFVRWCVRPIFSHAARRGQQTWLAWAAGEMDRAAQTFKGERHRRRALGLAWEAA